MFFSERRSSRLGWLGTLFAVSAAIGAQPYQTARITTGRSNAPLLGDRASYSLTECSVSDNGRYSIFWSTSTNLIKPSPPAGQTDLYYRDRWSNTITRIKFSFGGAEFDPRIHQPMLSSDGRYLLFDSPMNYIDPSDSNGLNDVFRMDMQTGSVIRASRTDGGGNTNGSSTQGWMSGDGRYVCFVSTATNLIAGATGQQIYWKDMATGLVKLVSKNDSAIPANGPCWSPSISDDGSRVAYLTTAVNLGQNGKAQVIVNDVVTNAYYVGSQTNGGSLNGVDSFLPRISGDGKVVVFASEGSNLAEGDSPNTMDVFRRDISGHTTELVSWNDNESGHGAENISNLAVDSTASRIGFTTTRKLRDFPASYNPYNRVKSWVRVRSGLNAGNTYEAGFERPGFSRNCRIVLSQTPFPIDTIINFDINGVMDVYYTSDVTLTQQKYTIESVRGFGNDSDGSSSLAGTSYSGDVLNLYSYAHNLTSAYLEDAPRIHIYDVSNDAVTGLSGSGSGLTPVRVTLNGAKAISLYAIMDIPDFFTGPTIDSSSQNPWENTEDNGDGGFGLYPGYYLISSQAGTQLGSSDGFGNGSDMSRDGLNIVAATRVVYDEAETISFQDRMYRSVEITYSTFSSPHSRVFLGGETPAAPFVKIISSTLHVTGDCTDPIISADGKVVVFRYKPADSPRREALYIYNATDYSANVTRLICRVANENQTIGRITISEDGRWLAFSADDDSLSPGDSNGVSDIYVADLARLDEAQSVYLKRMTFSSTGGNANGASDNAWITGDGRYVYYDSLADNLVNSDKNLYKDVFRTRVLDNMAPNIYGVIGFGFNYGARALPGLQLEFVPYYNGGPNPRRTVPLYRGNPSFASFSFEMNAEYRPYRMKARVAGSLWRYFPHVQLLNGLDSRNKVELLFGDINGDNQVTIADQTLLTAANGSTPGSGNWNSSADFNCDNVVNAADQTILNSNLGKVGD